MATLTTRTKVIGFACAAVLAAAGMALSLGRPDPSDQIDALVPSGPGPLDGMTFVGMLGPDGAPKDVPDILVFQDGTFLSLECRQSCDYPARPYTAARTDDGWTFESRTRCPYKDSTIHWRGTVTGDRIEGIVTWTMHRWYWSIERDFAFEAVLDPDPDLSRYRTE